MTVTSKTTDLLDSALAAWSRESHVRLYKVEHFGEDDILEYEINWAALGGCSVNEAEKFCDDLRVVSRLANDLNASRYHVLDIWGEQGPVIPVSMRQEKINQRQAIVEKLLSWLKEGKWASVTRWFEDQRIA